MADARLLSGRRTHPGPQTPPRCQFLGAGTRRALQDRSPQGDTVPGWCRAIRAAAAVLGEPLLPFVPSRDAFKHAGLGSPFGEQV